MDSPNQLRIGFGPDMLQLDVDVNGPGDIFSLDRATLVAELNASGMLPYGEVLEGVLNGDPCCPSGAILPRTAGGSSSRCSGPGSGGDVPLEEYDAGSVGPADWPTGRRGLKSRQRKAWPAPTR